MINSYKSSLNQYSDQDTIFENFIAKPSAGPTLQPGIAFLANLSTRSFITLPACPRTQRQCIS